MCMCSTVGFTEVLLLMGFTRLPTRGGAAARAAARAREEVCIVSNEKVAMLVWKLRRTLIGDRLDIQVNMGSCVCVLLWALQRSPRVAAPPRARRRARRESRQNPLAIFL